MLFDTDLIYIWNSNRGDLRLLGKISMVSLIALERIKIISSFRDGYTYEWDLELEDCFLRGECEYEEGELDETDVE